MLPVSLAESIPLVIIIVPLSAVPLQIPPIRLHRNRRHFIDRRRRSFASRRDSLRLPRVARVARSIGRLPGQISRLRLGQPSLAIQLELQLRAIDGVDWCGVFA